MKATILESGHLQIETNYDDQKGLDRIEKPLFKTNWIIETFLSALRNQQFQIITIGATYAIQKESRTWIFGDNPLSAMLNKRIIILS